MDTEAVHSRLRSTIDSQRFQWNYNDDNNFRRSDPRRLLPLLTSTSQVGGALESPFSEKYASGTHICRINTFIFDRYIIFIFAASGGDLPLSPWLGAIAGGLLSLIALIVLIGVRVRRARAVARAPQPSHDKLWPPPEPSGPPRLPPNIRATDTQAPTELTQDDRDPDVIPVNYGKFSL